MPIEKWISQCNADALERPVCRMQCNIYCPRIFNFCFLIATPIRGVYEHDEYVPMKEKITVKSLRKTIRDVESKSHRIKNNVHFLSFQKYRKVKGVQSDFFNFFSFLLEILIPQESSNFSHNLWQKSSLKICLDMVTII